MKGWKKKITGGILLVASCLFLSGCGVEEVGMETTLYKKGMEVIEKMDRMAEWEGYTGLMTSDLQVESLIYEIGEKDYTKPDAVYQVTITEENIQFILSLVSETDLEIPEEILSNIYRRFLSGIPASLNATEGTIAIAVSSILAADTDFLYKDLTESTMYLYLYQNAYSAVVLFSPMEQEIVRAQGMFVLNDQLLWNLTEREIMELLEGTGYLSGCEIQKIEVQ